MSKFILILSKQTWLIFNCRKSPIFWPLLQLTIFFFLIAGKNRKIIYFLQNSVLKFCYKMQYKVLCKCLMKFHRRLRPHLKTLVNIKAIFAFQKLKHSTNYSAARRRESRKPNQLYICNFRYEIEKEMPKVASRIRIRFSKVRIDQFFSISQKLVYTLSSISLYRHFRLSSKLN